MSKRNIVFWLVWVSKMAVVICMLLPAVIWSIGGLYTLFSGTEPTYQATLFVSFMMLLLLLATLHEWIYGHMPAIDAYYSALENSEQ